MKNQLGIVIETNMNSAKVKLNNKNCKSKIIKASNYEGAVAGEKVYIKFSKIVKLKLIYIKYIQPIIFSILGIIMGSYIGKYLNQPDLVYKCVFVCLFVTMAIVYKDYKLEKNKLSLKYLPEIKRIK